jgi:putrescine transport system substrate-binding protein
MMQRARGSLGNAAAARRVLFMLALIGCLLCASCGRPSSNGEDSLNIYGWSDYRDEALLRKFTQTTGIKVRYDIFDSSDAVEAKLLAGSTGYDIMTVSNPYLGRQVPLGLYEMLDRTRLPDWNNIDRRVLDQIAAFDPGNRHAMPYVWGVTGTIYNVDAVATRMPDAPLDSLGMFFDPKVASKFADCGISIFDLPLTVYQMVLVYLGRDPNQFTDANLAAAQQQLLQVRPYIRRFDTANWAQTTLNGDVCVAMGWPGTMARMLAEMSPGQLRVRIKSTMPVGSELYFDNLAILADAPHRAAAYKYLEFLLDAHNAAEHVNHIRYAVANKAAEPFIAPAILHNPDYYPTAAALGRAHQQTTVPQDFQGKMTRSWTELKAAIPK